MKDCRVVECVTRVENNGETFKWTPESVELPAAFLEEGTTAVLPISHGHDWAIIVGRKDKALFELQDITNYGHFEEWAQPVRGRSRSKPLTDFHSYTVASFRRRRRRRRGLEKMYASLELGTEFQLTSTSGSPYHERKESIEGCVRCHCGGTRRV